VDFTFTKSLPPGRFGELSEMVYLLRKVDARCPILQEERKGRGLVKKGVLRVSRGKKGASV